MHGARGDVQHIPGAHGQPVQCLLHPAGPGQLRQFFLAGGHAVGQLRPGFAVQHHPSLGLAQLAPFVGGGVGVVRMHLHAQKLPGVQQLDQQREGSFDFAGQILAPQANHAAQSAARLGPVEHQTLPAFQRGNLKGFAGLVVGGVLQKYVPQHAPAPGSFAAVAKIRGHQQWIHRISSLPLLRFSHIRGIILLLWIYRTGVISNQ